MTWDEAIQYGQLIKKRKNAKNLKEFLKIDRKIKRIFPGWKNAKS